MASRKPFTKPWCSIDDLLALLEERGLTIDDPAFAREALHHVNYYRFSGYTPAAPHAHRRMGLTDDWTEHPDWQ